MQIWNSLVATALLGTEREPLPPDTTSGELSEALSKILTDQSAAATALLLKSAALIELYQRAGQTMPTSSAAPPAECPDDTAAPCALRAAAHLSTLIQEENEALLAEWLMAARGLGKTVPPILLPPLLQLGVNKNILRLALIQSCNERSCWLAKQNSDWEYVLAGAEYKIKGDFKAIWETGEPYERLGVLQALRKAEPDTARELLLSTWSQEPPDDRARFLSELRVGLSLSDEPFIEEQALDDKRKEVREAAIQLLTTLSGSRLTQRMIARANACLTVTANGIEVFLPPACDKSMERDGIKAKAPPGIGDKAYWLLQTVGAVPPNYWVDTCKTTINGLIDLAFKNKAWTHILISAWQMGATTHKDNAWAMELIAHAKYDLTGLIKVLNQEQKESLLMSAIKTGGSLSDGQSHYAQILHLVLREDKTTDTLSSEISRALISSLKAASTQSGQQIYQNPVLSVLPSLALRLHPSLMEEAVSGWSDSFMKHDYSRKIMDQFMHTVQFRNEMHMALRE